MGLPFGTGKGIGSVGFAVPGGETRCWIGFVIYGDIFLFPFRSFEERGVQIIGLRFLNESFEKGQDGIGEIVLDRPGRQGSKEGGIVV